MAKFVDLGTEVINIDSIMSIEKGSNGMVIITKKNGDSVSSSKINFDFIKKELDLISNTYD